MVADWSYPCMERDFPNTWMAIKFQNGGYQRLKFLLRPNCRTYENHREKETVLANAVVHLSGVKMD